MKGTALKHTALLAVMAAFGGWAIPSGADEITRKSSTVIEERTVQRVQGAQPEEGAIIYRSTVISVEPASRLSTTVSLPPGIKAKENKAAKEAIRDVLKKVTHEAVHGELSNVYDQFAGPDRERLEKYSSGNTEKLGLASEHFLKLWGKKYHSDFDMNQENLVYGPQYVAIRPGEISDPGLLKEWPVEPILTGNAADTPTGRQIRTHLDNGRDVALVVFPASAGMPEFTGSFIHQAPDFWKIDVPDTTSVRQLKNSLTVALNHMVTHVKLWPANVEDGYRMVTRHVLAALYGFQQF